MSGSPSQRVAVVTAIGILAAGGAKIEQDVEVAKAALAAARKF
jgi:uncharacterized protein GlcG (DUF336 family)